MTDIFNRKKRSELMSKVRVRGTDIELILKKELRKSKVRYGNRTKVFGKPDIVFSKRKVAVFCDGDFWHGRNYEKEKRGYKKFWRDKIARNIERDAEVNKQLRKEGWKVLRFWKIEIKKNPGKCAENISKVLGKRAAIIPK